MFLQWLGRGAHPRGILRVGRGNIHREQAGLLEGGCLLLSRDSRNCLCLFSLPAPVVAIMMMYVCELVLEVS